MKGGTKLLAVDGSALRRQTWAAIANDVPGLVLSGAAVSVEEAWALVVQHQPDVILLDLELGGTDAFVFLARVMADRPTPVLVLVGKSPVSRDRAVRALEHGAADLLTAPIGGRGVEPRVRDELVGKLVQVERMRIARLAERAERARLRGTAISQPIPLMTQEIADELRKDARVPPPRRVLAIGASTGGPAAVTQLLSGLDSNLGYGVLLTQHMPPRFTRSFAERLNRATSWTVREAEGGDVLGAGTVLVAPGGGSLRLRRAGPLWKVDIEVPTGEERFVPSIDRMLETAAEAAGKELVACILTGMAGDGSLGLAVVRQRGGHIVVESPASAALSGMPEEAIESGPVDHVGTLVNVVDYLARYVRRAGAAG